MAFRVVWNFWAHVSLLPPLLEEHAPQHVPHLVRTHEALGSTSSTGRGLSQGLTKCSVNTLAIKPSRKKGQPKPSLTSSAPCHGHPQPPRVSFYRGREKQSPAVDHNPKVCHPLTSPLWPPATMLLVISSAWNSGYLSYLHLPIGHVWQKPGSLPSVCGFFCFVLFLI